MDRASTPVGPVSTRGSRRLSALLAATLLLCSAGCATHFDRLQPIRDDFYAGRLDAAETRVVEELSNRHKSDDEVLQLDQAMIELVQGRSAEAERLLRQSRDRLEETRSVHLGEEALSMVTDDTARAYSGEDYERVLIRAMLSLSNLMNGGGDAAAYALQVVDEQQKVIERVRGRKDELPEAEAAYKQVALGPYVRAMLAEESPLTFTDAQRYREQVVSYQPDFAFGQRDLERVTSGHPTGDGRGALYVFVLLGRGPVKEEVEELPTQAAMLIADRIISNNVKRGVTPTLAPIKIARVRRSPPLVDGVDVRWNNTDPSLDLPGLTDSANGVSINGASLGQTATLVDIGRMACEQYDARLPEVVGRLVARRTIKKGAMYAVKEIADVQRDSPLSLALNVVGIAWEATEVADTRCWGLLPDQIQVLRAELPVGTQELSLEPWRAGRLRGNARTVRVEIREGRNTYLMLCVPDRDVVGEVLVSHQADAEDPGVIHAEGLDAQQ